MRTLTVTDVLKLNIFHHASLVTGREGLSRPVSSITTVEDTDLLHYLKDGEILLLSIRFASEVLHLGEHMELLASKQIAAIILKGGTDNVTEPVPGDILRNASRFSIPVVLLPPDVRFIDAISAVMSLVMKVKNRYYLDIQNNLTKAVASGFQEEDILHYLGDYIPGYFTVTDSEGQQLQQHTASGFDPNTAVADRLRLLILCMGKVTGYLTSVTNSFLEEHQEMLLKTASHLLSVLVLKKYYVAKIEQKYISGFLSELFEKRLSPDAIVEKAHNYGWNRGDSYAAISLELSSERSKTKVPEALMEITAFLPEENCFFYIKEPYLHVLLRSVHPASMDLCGAAAATLEQIQAYLNKQHRTLSLFAGISSQTTDVSTLSKKVQEAYDALQFGHAFGNPIVKYNDMGVLRLLASHSNFENFAQIIPPAVQKLADYDKENNTEYLQTLDSLLGNNLNLSKTAKQLFIHYKTMLHRMNRICEIAEISLDDRQTRLDVELGVKLYMMLPK